MIAIATEAIRSRTDLTDRKRGRATHQARCGVARETVQQLPVRRQGARVGRQWTPPTEDLPCAGEPAWSTEKPADRRGHIRTCTVYDTGHAN